MLTRRKTLLAASLLSVSLFPVASAETAEERGYAIMERSDRSDAGFGTQSVRLTMTLADSRGRTTVRELQIDTLEKQGDGNGDRSLTRFFSPPDVEGTALLSHAKILDPDDQWLYLPALRRVKRISSANKSGPFVGSEFAFEDLTSNELGKYRYTLVDTVDYEGMTLYKIECVPLYERSGYTKLYCYVDDKVYQTRGIEFFDRGGNALKTLRLTEFQEYAGGYWRPHKQVMENHITGKTTVLDFATFEFGVGLNRRDFEPSALDRL